MDAEKETQEHILKINLHIRCGGGESGRVVEFYPQFKVCSSLFLADPVQATLLLWDPSKGWAGIGQIATSNKSRVIP